MPKTPSMTAAEAESAIGQPRGSARVTSENRHLFRKWLTARGLNSAFVGGLSVTELGLAYNDASDVQFNRVKAKYEKAKAEDGIEEGDAEQAASSDATATATTTAGAGVAGNAADASRQIAEAIAKLMALQSGACDPEQVRSIVRAEIANIPPRVIEIRDRDVLVGKVEGRQHPRFADLVRVLSQRDARGWYSNVWLSGPPGAGKTHGADTAAKALGAHFHFNGALLMAHELLGFIDANGRYHATPFRRAFEHGGVYLFDEIDGSDNSAILPLNAALANGSCAFPDATVPRHPDFRVIASANTWGLGATADFVGRAKIDAAIRSRFPVRLSWDYDPDLEAAICGNETFARRVQKARAKAQAAGLKVVIDPRASIAGAALIAAGYTEDQAASMTYLADLSADQRKNLGE